MCILWWDRVTWRRSREYLADIGRRLNLPSIYTRGLSLHVLLFFRAKLWNYYYRRHFIERFNQSVSRFFGKYFFFSNHSLRIYIYERNYIDCVRDTLGTSLNSLLFILVVGAYRVLIAVMGANRLPVWREPLFNSSDVSSFLSLSLLLEREKLWLPVRRKWFLYEQPELMCSSL